MHCQKHLFNLPAGIHYLNCATRGPLSHSVERAGISAIQKTTSWIHQLAPADFFEPAWEVRRLFAQLIHAPDPERIALIPAVSYALGIVAHNLPQKTGFRSGQKIILTEGEFPSDVYAWERVAARHSLSIHTVPMPEGPLSGTLWNESILESIDEQTALVICPAVHWMYGFRFDLERISARARHMGAWLVVDGTQSVGALPFDYAAIRPDVLVCAGYKWLMGPYSLGLAVFGEAFDEGIPLEETWMARQNSDQFHTLTNYQSAYRPGAFRYNMGEQSNFIHLPMLKASLEQLLQWIPEAIQAYCHNLLSPILPDIRQAGYQVDDDTQRASHLVGIRIPSHRDVIQVQRALAQAGVYVSARGRGLRISPHLYNTPEDAVAFQRALLQS